MPMPEGIVTVRINRNTGCPADSRTNIEDVMFESFRVGNVPQCQVADSLEDPFNMDDDLGATGHLLPPETIEDSMEEEPEAEETLF